MTSAAVAQPEFDLVLEGVLSNLELNIGLGFSSGKDLESLEHWPRTGQALL